MGLTFSSERRGESSVIHLQGEFDLRSNGEVRSAVAPLLEDPGGEVFLDLQGVTFLDSSGLGTLVGLQKLANRSQSRVTLCGLSPQLERIFQVTNLRDAFTILPEVPSQPGQPAS
jgi:anti-anti-sigma factor